MEIDVLEFSELEKLVKKGKHSLDCLAPEIGKVYVVALTRDNCPACKKQKPRLDRLAAVMTKKHGGKLVFTKVHVKYSDDSREESLRCKDTFRHYFYPTNLVLVRTRDRGPLEYYRSVSPSMKELERNIESALEVAAMFKEEQPS